MVRNPGRPGGFSLVEALVVTVLLSLVVHGAWRVLVRHRDAGLRVAFRAEGLEAIRTLAWLVPEEVSGGRAGLDWEVPSEDVLSLRAFRGTGLVHFPSDPSLGFRVCFRGLRAPVPGKDSVLALGLDGRWRAYDLVGRVRLSEGCAGLEDANQEGWTLSPDPPPSVLARLFERGSYHLSEGALRYRRGEGGRQPLTVERLQNGRFLGPEVGGNPLSWQVQLLETSKGGVDWVPGRAWRGAQW